MKSRPNVLHVVSLLVLMVLTALTTRAQVTSSSLSGRVVIEDTGETAIGATITAVHEPTATRYQVVANTEGRYAIQGMRNGGPYTVTVSYIGFAPKVFHDITLRLGESSVLDVVLKETQGELAEVVVSGRASKLNNEKIGTAMNIDAATIADTPNPEQSLQNIIRLSAYANEEAGLAGGSARMNNFKLDGANLNNEMGVTKDLPGGGTPVPLASIDEMQIVVAPFDVRQSNFVTGGINAVTKSGTNTLKGTGYIYYNNEDMHGNRVNGKELADRDPEEQTALGFTLGGPIVRNKLFFFLNYEGLKKPAPATHGTNNDMERVRQHLLQRYGYDVGSNTNYPNGRTDSRFLIRLDWNIHLNHHMTVRFNHTTNRMWDTPSTYATDAVQRMTTARAIYFSNSMFQQISRVTTFSFDLHSRFGQQLSNQLLMTWSDMRDTRTSDSEPFPFIDIMGGYDASTQTQTLTSYMSMGYELFAWNNAVKSSITTVTDNLTYYRGNHKLTAGMSWEHQSNRNFYMRNGLGFYRYRSLDEFLNGDAPETVAISYGYDGDSKPFTRVRFNQFGFYLQDEWNVTPKLKLSIGLRADKLSLIDSDVRRNNIVYGLDFGGRHIDTGCWPNIPIQWTPRLGASWDIRGDGTLRLRGGTGLFAGRMPMAFLTNMPHYSAMWQNQVVATTTYNGTKVVTVDPRLASFKGGIITDTRQMVQLLKEPTSLPEQGVVPGEIVAIDPDFKMPQVWKTVVAVDYTIPVSFPLTVTGELTYTRNISDLCMQNYNVRTPDATWQRLQGADNRWLYPVDHRYDPTYTAPDGTQTNYHMNTCVLTNTSRGHGWTACLSLKATPVKDLQLSLSYTHTVLRQINSMPGTNTTSLWSGRPTVNGPNLADLESSVNVCPHRIIGSMSWRTGHHRLSLFYHAYRPGAYSYMYANDLNGDGVNNDLIYIPRDDSEIRFDTDADRQAFWQFVEQDDYLRSHKGSYAEAYAVHAPWVHKFDLHWSFEMGLRTGNIQHKLELLVDVDNITNFFNSRWGVAQGINNQRILQVKSITNGVPTFTSTVAPGASSFVYSSNSAQCWKVCLGLRYHFN